MSDVTERSVYLSDYLSEAGISHVKCWCAAISDFVLHPWGTPLRSGYDMGVHAGWGGNEGVRGGADCHVRGVIQRFSAEAHSA